MHFSEKIRNLSVEPGTLALCWLGQAGFLMKTDEQKIIVIDPYLTDYTYDVLKDQLGWAFKRITAPVCEPEELPFDVMLISHEHADHLDMYGMQDFVSRDGVQLGMTAPSVEILKAEAMDISKVVEISKGTKLAFGNTSVKVVDCDHGDEAPEAVGFLLDFGFVTLYYAGDTAMSLERLQEAVVAEPEVALLPINGTYGNLNSEEAYRLTGMLKSKYCIPYHFWTFSGQQGDPLQLIRLYEEQSCESQLQLLTPGEIMILEKKEQLSFRRI